MQADRRGCGCAAPAARHVKKRVLLLFGLIHAHVFWYGDVLAEYAMCGMLLYPLRRLRVQVLIACGLCLLSVATLYHWADTHNLNIGIVHWLRDGAARLTYGVTGNDFEFRAYTGSWRQQMQTRFWVALDNQTYSFLNWTFWRCGGSMLIGMALLKLRFFHGEWPRRAYPALAAIGIPVGWGITVLGVLHNQAYGWFDGEYPDFAGMEFNYWGSLVTAFGYMALGVYFAILVASGYGRLAAIARPLRAIGRTALSNYILQTLIGTTIFYGHGFGYFGWMSRAELVWIVLAVWAFQLVASTLWMRRFQQGPLEWVWHRSVYGILA